MDGGVMASYDKSDKKDKILAEMRTRLSGAVSVYSETRANELEDLRFLAGSSDNNWQWPTDVMSARGAAFDGRTSARPCLTINRLPQHVRQVTNDQRQNRPSGKVIPVDDNADIKMAEVFDGMVRHIEYISDADVAYDTACENQVIFGEGYVRILTEYVDDMSFDQDIKIGRIRNSFSVYMDPMIQDPCGSDAEWCVITEDITKEEFERLYPDAAPISSITAQWQGDSSISQWIGEDTIRIAEYFYVDHNMETLNLYPGNVTAFEGTSQDKALKAAYGKPLKSRLADRKKIKWCKTNGYEALDERDWAGNYIPVVRVIGNEFEIEGQLHISGLVRNAKDAQRMYNYHKSQEAEMLALAPKAPFIGYGGQFEGYENQWRTANTQNWPYLEVNPDATDGSGATLPLPQRAQPPMASTGLLQASAGAIEDIKAVTGQYNAALGMTSNERSGKAILARQREADTGTYHYIDNMARLVRYVTRQLIDLIPKIYDTNRIARIIGEDGTSKMVKIDPLQTEAVKTVKDGEGNVIAEIYNPSVGKYDVYASTGPGYATKRQEAMESMAQLLQGNPQLWAVAGDLFVKNMDWPGAQEMAERLAKTIDPKLLNKDGENPELQAAQVQMQEMAQEMQQMHQMLQSMNQSIEVREVQVKENDSLTRAYDAETKRISAVQSGLTPEQVQDIAMGTVDAALGTGDISNGSPEMSSEEYPNDDQGMVQ